MFRKNKTKNIRRNAKLFKNSQRLLKNKSSATAILLVLTFAFVIIFPAVNAHTPPWTFTTVAYINASPNPVGKGQSTLIVMWLDYTIQGVSISNNIRFRNYQLTIMKPNGAN